MKPRFSLLAIACLGFGLELAAQAASAEPLRLKLAAFERAQKAENRLDLRTDAQNDFDRAVSLVRRRMGGRGSFVSAERLDDSTFRITWKDGNRIFVFRVNVRNESVDDE